MSQNENFTELEEKLGYTFKKDALLKRALTHSSYTNEMKAKGGSSQCNERLEFLGDSVLSLIVSEFIFRDHPNLPEGELSRIRAGTVCERALGVYAKEISLGEYLYIGKGEEQTDGRNRVSVLSDAFEAVLAAIYLDGGIEPVKSFLMPFITAEIEEIFKSGHTEDFKTMLQQIVQQDKGERLEYILVSENGPPHRRVFSVEARLNSNVIGRGEGKSKRDAEQVAAKQAVELFGVK